MNSSGWVCKSFVVLGTLMTSAPLLAQETGKIEVEFNDLQPADKGCRAVFVVHNGLQKEIEKLTFRVVAFDKDAHAKLFLSMDVGTLPSNKTRVLRFDLGTDTACADVSRLLLDDVISCEGKDLGPRECLAAVATSSRAAAPLDY